MSGEFIFAVKFQKEVSNFLTKKKIRFFLCTLKLINLHMKLDQVKSFFLKKSPFSLLILNFFSSYFNYLIFNIKKNSSTLSL